MTVDSAMIARIDEWWRAATYLSVGQIYLRDNPMLERPLEVDDLKARLLGHFGTVPGLNLVYAHMNRVILERDSSVLFIAGPGHGGPAMYANAWLDGTYSELYPEVPRDAEGMRALFRQFSFPGGVPSHTAPETPGSIQEGGELGYSLSHAYGAALDDPDLTVVCVIGDGEAETGPLATAWHGNSFLDPRRDGAVLPILHLNGWKIANPTVLARIPEQELAALMTGYGYAPIFVTINASDPRDLAHERFATALDRAFDGIDALRAAAERGDPLPPWPMIVLRSPKGWSGPEEVDGQPVEGTWRSHQVPLAGVRDDADHRRLLEEWMRSYRPYELFDESGSPREQAAGWGPRGSRRMSANPQANGGAARQPLDLPGFGGHAVAVAHPGSPESGATEVLGGWLADVARRNPATFRLFSPDEAESNRVAPAIFDVTGKQWNAAREPVDEHLAPHGRVMEVLSEHQCQGWLEGYTLTGRHGVFTSYEAFIHIVDSMFNQHAKWMEACADVPWREPLPSFTYLLSSHVWQQDHNGFTHQDPGFLGLALDKSPEIVRVYLPFDANTLLVTMAQCLESTDRINVVVAGKKPAPQWLDLDDAREHVRRGIGELPWAGTAPDGGPDVVLAAAGDVPTQEVIAAAQLLRERIPSLKIRVVSVIDLSRLQSPDQHPNGLADADFDALFTTDRPIVFAFHGYPWLIHRLAYKRAGHDNLHVHGYRERGTTTTPFDMLMLNDVDRYRIAIDVIDRVPGLAEDQADLRAELVTAREQARRHTREHGVDIPAVVDWTFAPAR